MTGIIIAAAVQAASPSKLKRRCSCRSSMHREDSLSGRTQIPDKSSLLRAHLSPVGISTNDLERSDHP
jgi:hypothetical protein